MREGRKGKVILILIPFFRHCHNILLKHEFRKLFPSMIKALFHKRSESKKVDAVISTQFRPSLG